MPPPRGVQGFPGVLLVFLVFAPIFALLIRRKLRLAEARREEVRRLVLLAEEEDIRAEIEASVKYRYEFSAAPTVVVGGGGRVRGVGGSTVRQCAVCYSPTTTRCARCKAIRYCSGKCQIIHWRQGHKDECRPPNDDHRDASGSSSKLDGTWAEQFMFSEDNSDTSKSMEADLRGYVPSESSCFSSLSLKEDDLETRNQLGHFDTDNSSDSCVVSSTSSSAFKPSAKKSESSSNRRSPMKDESPSSFGIASGDPGTSVSTSETVNLHKLHSDTATLNFSVNRESCSSELAGKFGSKSGLYSCPISNVNFKNLNSRGLADQVDMTHGSDLNCSSAIGNSFVSKANKGIDLDSNITSQISFSKSAEVISSQMSSQRTVHSDSYLSSKNTSVCKANNALPTVIGDMDNVSDGTPNKLSENAGSALNGGLKAVRKVVQQLRQSRPSNTYNMIFPYDLFLKLYNEKVDLHPCGLANLGNSCYANAVLQCLLFTRPLAAYFLQGFHNKKCPKREWCFMCEFENLVVKVKQGKPISPTGILSQVHNIGSHLGHGKEEDAHEFLRYAVDAMQSICCEETCANVPRQLAEETTLMQLIFGGYLRSKIKCMRCHHKSVRRERMMDLTVEIPGDVETLEDALRRFTTTETLDGENKYLCDRCKTYEKALKKLTVAEAPNILTIVLKRFQSGKFGKINKPVQFPEILNLAPYMSCSSDKSPVYSLYAAVVHLDIMNAAFSGHYVCYVKSPQGKWYKTDDSTVKPVDLDRVLAKGAYMLLYARCSPRAPSLSSDMISNSSEMVKGRTGVHSGSRWSESNHFKFFSTDRTSKWDSSSDSSSLLSHSDEGSCSTESTRDSTSTEDYDQILGDSGYYSPFSFSEDSDGFSYSPSSHRYSHETVSYGHSPEMRRCVSYTSNPSYLICEGPGGTRILSYDDNAHGHDRIGKGQDHESPSFLPSDTTKLCRNLTEQYSSSRKTDWYNTYEAKSSSFTRRTSRDKMAQAF